MSSQGVKDYEDSICGLINDFPLLIDYVSSGGAVWVNNNPRICGDFFILRYVLRFRLFRHR